MYLQNHYYDNIYVKQYHDILRALMCLIIFWGLERKLGSIKEEKSTLSVMLSLLYIDTKNKKGCHHHKIPLKLFPFNIFKYRIGDLVIIYWCLAYKVLRILNVKNKNKIKYQGLDLDTQFHISPSINMFHHQYHLLPYKKIL